MNNPMVIGAENIIIDFESEKGEIVANVTDKPTANYDYCFMGIKLDQATVADLKAAMQADSQFYLEITFNDVLNGEVAAESKFVHQFFDYAVLVDQVEDLEIKMDGYYELPASYATTSVNVIAAKLYYVAAPTE